MEVSEILHRSISLVFVINLSENKFNTTERLISQFKKNIHGEIDLPSLLILSWGRLISIW